MGIGRGWSCCLLLVGLAAGCGRAPAPPDTGAKEAVQCYYEAIIRQDWNRAYSALHAESRSRFSRDQFARLANDYRNHLGFQPAAAHVRACEEHGSEAIAHVTLTGRGRSRTRYKDGVVLRQSDDGWGIVLAHNFGRTSKQ